MASLAGIDLPHLKAERNVLPGRQVGKQRIRLEHHADIALVGRLPCDVLTADDHPSAVGLLQTRDQAQRRRFTTAGWPEQSDQLARGHRQTQAVERRHPGVAALEVLEPNLDTGACGGPHPGGRDRSRHLWPPPAKPGNGTPARSGATRARARPKNDRITSRIKANSSDATETAIEVPALARPSWKISTWRLR